MSALDLPLGFLESGMMVFIVALFHFGLGENLRSGVSS